MMAGGSGGGGGGGGGCDCDAKIAQAVAQGIAGIEGNMADMNAKIEAMDALNELLAAGGIPTVSPSPGTSTGGGTPPAHTSVERVSCMCT